jgi:hypothetical protein
MERHRVGGAKLVTHAFMRSTPDQHDPDWPRYPETVLTFATSPQLEIDLRQPLSESALTGLKRIGLADPFAVLTAYDPRGADLPREENERRRRQLNDRLKRSGYKFLEVDACSPDRSHCEQSVAVVMPQREAIALATQLEQVAIFWFDGERFWILGAYVDLDPLMLPRSS